MVANVLSGCLVYDCAHFIARWLLCDRLHRVRLDPGPPRAGVEANTARLKGHKIECSVAGELGVQTAAEVGNPGPRHPKSLSTGTRPLDVRSRAICNEVARAPKHRK